MPQRRKSKRQGRHTQHQAQGETQSRGHAQATAAAAAAATAAEPTPSSFPQCEDLIQSLPDVEPRSTGQQPQEAPPVTTVSTHTTSDEASDDEDQDRPRITEVPLDTQGSCKFYYVSTIIDVLEHFLVQKYKLKQPILKEDMLKIIGKENESQLPEILKKTSKRIEILFALDLKEGDSPRPSYDLVSKLKLPNNGRVRPGRGYPKTGLLMRVLGIILLHNGCAPEEDMWKHLRNMRLYPGRRHFFYEEPRKLITQTLVRLKYLEYRQMAGSDPPCYEILWGPKAHAETSRKKILEFIVNSRKEIPSVFPIFCEKAVQDEEEKAQVRAAASLGTTGHAQKGLPTSTEV
ncbi:melanoma-associated antigen B5-like [Manis pentadactyla]|uniref:melanoma-associated antigen B5-like n=1 Tax=Manis pentadactyla TaxID=143292 RepID=UPI00255CFC65|nr:melanoma-associated antigen B5-like [Manis pentadactyla]